MKPRTKEQIQEHLLQPKNLKFLEEATSKYYSQISQREMDKLYSKINRFILKAAFGEKVFRGTEGRAFKAISEHGRDYKLRNDKAREIGKNVQEGLARINWVIKMEIGAKLLDKYPLDKIKAMRHGTEGTTGYMRTKAVLWQTRGRTQTGLEKYFAEKRKMAKKQG